MENYFVEEKCPVCGGALYGTISVYYCLYCEEEIGDEVFYSYEELYPYEDEDEY